MRKVLFFSSTRAEFGLLKPIMEKVKKSNVLELQLIVTGTHLSEKYGYTLDEIKEAGISPDKLIDMNFSGSDAMEHIHSLGEGLAPLGTALKALNPDIIVLLGDRFELMSIAVCAILFNIPIAHIHGGEVTEGAVDEKIRHALTKFSNLHFVASEEYKERVLQMGESSKNVWVSGGPGIDNMLNVQSLSEIEMNKRMKGYKWQKKNFLITFHSETQSVDYGIQSFNEMLFALDQFKDVGFIFTYPNIDMGSDQIIERLKKYVASRPGKSYLTESLGLPLYKSCMEKVDLVIGNSSSGIIEAPVFKIPTINIGIRQQGRLKGHSIIDVDGHRDDIKLGIEKALSGSFQSEIENLKPLYGEGNASHKIVEVLESADLSELKIKKFIDRV